MNIFRRFFRKSARTGSSMHTLVGNEIQFLIDASMRQCNITTRERIVTEVNSDPMKWFEVRSRQYGESGSHYGIAEIVAEPGGSTPMWPTWVTLIPSSQLSEVQFAASELSEERCPLGGHNMDEENRRKAVCEFADHILWTLLQTEEEIRPSTSPDSR